MYCGLLLSVLFPLRSQGPGYFLLFAVSCQPLLLSCSALPVRPAGSPGHARQCAMNFRNEKSAFCSVHIKCSVSPFLQLGIVLLCVPILYYSFNIHQYNHRISEPSFFRSPQQDFCGGDLECKGCYVPDEWSLKVRHGSCLHFVQLPV